MNGPLILTGLTVRVRRIGLIGQFRNFPIPERRILNTQHPLTINHATHVDMLNPKRYNSVTRIGTGTHIHFKTSHITLNTEETL